MRLTHEEILNNIFSDPCMESYKFDFYFFGGKIVQEISNENIQRSQHDCLQPWYEHSDTDIAFVIPQGTYLVTQIMIKDIVSVLKKYFLSINMKTSVLVEESSEYENLLHIPEYIDKYSIYFMNKFTIVDKWDLIFLNGTANNDHTVMKTFISAFDIDICQIAKYVGAVQKIDDDDIECAFLEYVKCIKMLFPKVKYNIPNDVLLKIKNFAIKSKTYFRYPCRYIFGSKWNPLAIHKFTPVKFVKFVDGNMPLNEYEDVVTKRVDKYKKRGFQFDEYSIDCYKNECKRLTTKNNKK